MKLGIDLDMVCGVVMVKVLVVAVALLGLQTGQATLGA
jgi:hypothetical protein